MLDLIIPRAWTQALLGAIEHHRRDRVDPEPFTHPSLTSKQYEIVSRETWDKHDKPYLGPKRKRTAEFYRSRYVSKKVKKLPKSLPF